MLPDDVNQADVLADVTAAFYRYEKALTGNDVAVLDELFWHDEKTVRYGAGENLYGIEEIRAFRLARPSAGLDRALRNTVITTYGHDMAVASTEFTRTGSTKIGRQMQTWVKMPE
ncbi:oxalurate catabolism protein HpxZ, partial [Dickeya dadantii]|nr:oxalurate catabolism protein HpxZ [Dickeya dadantii]